MAACYHCGEELEFFHDGFRAIPVHPSGSCGGRGWGGGSGRGSSVFRTTSDGTTFQFPFITYPSYVNPNARCPVCGAAVYFYQSPYGGRVFFDELGPPWPKHPCTDHPAVHQHFSTAEGRARIFTQSQSAQAVQAAAETSTPGVRGLPPAWVADGWMPFIVKTVVPRPVGIEAIGEVFPSAASEAVPFRIVQSSSSARFHRAAGAFQIGYSLVQNAVQVLSVLNECPILLKQNPDMRTLLLSSFVLTPSGEVEEINMPVNGQSLEPATAPS